MHSCLRMCQECRAARAEREEERVRIRGRAHGLVGRAIARGELPRLSEAHVPCVDCGARAEVYDHRDYSKPLEVEPVCRKHNRRRGPARDVAHLWIVPLPKSAGD